MVFTVPSNSCFRFWTQSVVDGRFRLIVHSIASRRNFISQCVINKYLVKLVTANGGLGSMISQITTLLSIIIWRGRRFTLFVVNLVWFGNFSNALKELCRSKAHLKVNLIGFYSNLKTLNLIGYAVKFRSSITVHRWSGKRNSAKMNMPWETLNDFWDSPDLLWK